MERDTAEIAHELGAAGRGRLDGARGAAAARGDRPLPVGRAGRALPRLQLRDGSAGGATRSPRRSTRSGRALASPEQARRVRDQPARVRGAGRRDDQHAGHRQPVGRAVRLGAAADDRGRRACGSYGYEAEATRLARSSSALVVKEFEEHGTIVEKYDVERRESDVAAGIRFGYSANQIGFGWTNAAVARAAGRAREGRAAPGRLRAARARARGRRPLTRPGPRRARSVSQPEGVARPSELRRACGRLRGVLSLVLLLACEPAMARGGADVAAPASLWPARFEAAKSGLELRRRTRPGAFFDVVGRRSARVRLREPRARSVGLAAEAGRFASGCRSALEGYPLEIEGSRASRR